MSWSSSPSVRLAITGAICMYGNSSRFINTVITTVASITRLDFT